MLHCRTPRRVSHLVLILYGWFTNAYKWHYPLTINLNIYSHSSSNFVDLPGVKLLSQYNAECKNTITLCRSIILLSYFYVNLDLERMKNGRAQSKNPFRVELERYRSLSKHQIQTERENLKTAIQSITKLSQEVSLGILSETGSMAIDALKAWIRELELPHGELHAIDMSGQTFDIQLLMNVPVYLKYNSSVPQAAFMKEYRTEGFIGVVFQPVLNDGVFRQYGDLPLRLF
jgi:hypothetical protein